MNILVIQLARFGDFLQTTPLLSSLKRRYPQARLSVLVSLAQAGLAEANPEVDEVLSVDLKGLEKISRDPDTRLAEKIKLTGHDLGFLPQRYFDLVLNLNTSRVAALISELIIAGRREGARLAADRLSLLTPVWVRYIMRLMSHRRVIRLNLVDLLTGYTGLNFRAAAGLTYRVTERAQAQARTLLAPAGPRRLVGFQIGSRHLSRQWPPENFAQLAALLIKEAGANIIFLGLREERSAGRAVLDHLQRLAPDAAPRVLNLMGETSLETLGGVLSRLNLLVTTDTGTMHLAAAVSVPILALFMGPALCHETGPYGAGHVILQAMTACSPCSEGRAGCGDYSCRRLIRPETAFQAAMWLLNQDRDSGPPPDPPGSEVQLLLSQFDEFGVTYQPLAPAPLFTEELLAVAYREAGREFIRPGYRTDEAALILEFSRYQHPDRNELYQLQRGLASMGGLLSGSAANTQAVLKIQDLLQDQIRLAPLAEIARDLNDQGNPELIPRMIRSMTRIIDLAGGYFYPPAVRKAGHDFGVFAA